ncbi:MAG: thioredoxin family protein [Actinomycetota bacterium]|nr:thioredoxin family protein [Actinomycetota bacterium]
MDGLGVLGVVALLTVVLAVAGVGLVRRRYDGRMRTSSAGQGSSLADLGISLPAERAAIVQFTGEFCGSCEQARTMVERIVRDSPDVGHVEVDVAENIHAVRALDIRRTPTLIIVDRQGVPVHRASGMPREAELRQAVSELADQR